MSNQQNPPPSSFQPIPPPPPRPQGRGCLRMGLIGCGVLALLAVAAFVAVGIWWKRNEGGITAEALVAAREGARFGIANDEAACFEQAKQRAGGAMSVAGAFSVGTYMRSCLEFSRQTPAFCDDVPPQGALRRTAEWQSARCGGDADCRNVAQVVQQYCVSGRIKRQPADTMRLMGDSLDFGTSPPPGGAAADSGTF